MRARELLLPAPLYPGGVFLTQELNPHLLTSSALAGGFFTIRTTWEAAQRAHAPQQKKPWDKKPMHDN